jgi:DNA-binding response OmpR family regulator
MLDCTLQPTPKGLEPRVRAAKVLVVDDEYYSRKVIRTLLMAVGIVDVNDAADSRSGLDAIRAFVPDVVILDWEMPEMSGADFVRHVRSPARFPYPNVPIIMLTGHGERSRVMEAVRLGVHEFLLKPVSSAALHARIISVLSKPRPMIRRGDHYGPQPRRPAAYKPGDESYNLRPEQVVERAPAYKVFV